MSTDDYGCIEIALVISIAALRRIVRSLHRDGKHWWIASDPEDAQETGWISLGWGDRLCTDPLNTQYFRVPIVDSVQDETPDKMLVLFDASLIDWEDRHKRGNQGNSIGDFENFFNPLKTALIARLQAEV